MNPLHLPYLCCPRCQGALTLAEEELVGGRVASGRLDCGSCAVSFPIERFIPRFVPAENYCDTFSLQWNAHRLTQLDRHTGRPLSETRFREETKWGRDLHGEVIIEAGCGAGRFTEHAAATGAMILSFDYSASVDANQKNNGHLENLLIVQANVYEMPFPDAAAHRIYCFGVLQYTPDPERTLGALVQKIRPGGYLAVDIYKVTWHAFLKTKYWVRPITRRLDKERFFHWCHRYIDFMWPLARLNRRLFPRELARKINWQLLVPDYSHQLDDDVLLKEWAYLDIYDMLAPAYDNPARLSTMARWFADNGLVEVDLHYGYNGIEGRGRRP